DYHCCSTDSTSNHYIF
nr:immunoglobulin light chain junction region [Macaca mulatta]